MNSYAVALKKSVSTSAFKKKEQATTLEPLDKDTISRHQYHRKALEGLIGHLLLKKSNVIEVSLENKKSSSLSISQPIYTETLQPFGKIIRKTINSDDSEKWSEAIHMDQINCKQHSVTRKNSRRQKNNSQFWHLVINDLDKPQDVVDTWKICLDKLKNPDNQLEQGEEDSNIFLGFMGPDMYRSDTPKGLLVQEKVLKEMIRIGVELKENISSSAGSTQDPNVLDWDNFIQKQNAISGFGTNGIQLYVKSGFTVTLLHDEILWSHAVNLMTRHSKGCSLWISFTVIDACQVFTIEQISKMTENHNVYSLVQKLVKSEIKMSYCYQSPGTMIESPYGNGSMHLVISSADYIEQLAFNNLITTEGGSRCLWFWKNQPIEEANSGKATRYVLPCLKMQSEGYELGLGNELLELEAKKRSYTDMKNSSNGDDSDKLKNKKARIEAVTGGQNFSCSSCLRNMDMITVNDECIFCYNFINPQGESASI